jgi:hypothetical protein
MTGIQRRGAECIIGEIGTDMSRFASARHLDSWAGQCPGNDQSAGKRRSGKTRNGSKWLDYALEEAALAAIRVKPTTSPRNTSASSPDAGTKALGAVKHSMVCAIWHMLATGETYRDSAPTTSPTATPHARPSGSLPGSNASNTTSRSKRPQQPLPVRAARTRMY